MIRRVFLQVIKDTFNLSPAHMIVDYQLLQAESFIRSFIVGFICQWPFYLFWLLEYRFGINGTWYSVFIESSCIWKQWFHSVLGIWNIVKWSNDFGNKNLKTARKRQAGAEEELQRLRQ